jgi:hypothetical protein
LPPLLEQAPPAQHLIRNHHQRLLKEWRQELVAADLRSQGHQ